MILQQDLVFRDGVPQPVPDGCFVTVVLQMGPMHRSGAVLATLTIDSVQVAAARAQGDPSHIEVQTLAAAVPNGASAEVTLFGTAPDVATLSWWPLETDGGKAMKVESRAYQLGPARASVRIGATADFLVSCVAQSPHPVAGDVTVAVSDPSGAANTISLSVPANAGVSLGTLGTASGGSIVYDATSVVTLDIVLTVQTVAGAVITFSR